MACTPNWLVKAYVILLWGVIPTGIFLTLPLQIVGIVYFGTALAFAFVCLWYCMETFAAFLANKRKNPDSADLRGHRETIAYIIPAYLDNEACVLDDTLQSYCNLDYAGRIDVFVVYNTKRDMSVEENRLHTGWNDAVFGASSNVHIHFVKNENSTSKAENVNYGLEFIPEDCDFICIMDADHQPNPSNPSQAMRTITKEGYDILQGACTIRNQDNFLSTMVSVEFEDMYGVGHQGRHSVFDIGIFGGSNGYWKASVLKEIQMDGDMLTEDIDSSMRATLAGYKIGYSGAIISSELAPVQSKTLEKQRLRWAQGWAQVSVKYALPFIRSDLPLKQKVGLVYLLAWRESFTYLTFWPIICVCCTVFRLGHLTPSPLFTATGILIFAAGILRISVTYAVAKGPVGSRGSVFILYAFYNVWYAVYLNYVQVSAHGRSLMKMNNWVATVRERKNPESDTISEAPVNCEPIGSISLAEPESLA